MVGVTNRGDDELNLASNGLVRVGSTGNTMYRGATCAETNVKRGTGLPLL